MGWGGEGGGKEGVGWDGREVGGRERWDGREVGGREVCIMHS